MVNPSGDILAQFIKVGAARHEAIGEYIHRSFGPGLNGGLAFAQQETIHGFSRMKPPGRRGIWRYAYLFSLSNDLEFGFE